MLARLWYNERVRDWSGQLLLLSAFLGLFAWLYGNTVANLASRGIKVGPDFLFRPANFPISESVLPYSPSDPFWWAYVVGLGNTLLISLLAILLSTLLGVVLRSRAGPAPAAAPARAVVLQGLTKRTERGFRSLSHNELTQMAGRAGRRGIDTEGKCVIALDARDGVEDVVRVVDGSPEPIASQFRLGYGSVALLVGSGAPPEALRRRVEASFGQYQNLKRIREVEADLGRLEAARTAARGFAAPCGEFQRIGRYRALRDEVEARRRALGRGRGERGVVEGLQSFVYFATAATALDQLHTDARDALDENGKTAEPGVDTWESTNLLCVARVLVAAARLHHLLPLDRLLDGPDLVAQRRRRLEAQGYDGVITTIADYNVLQGALKKVTDKKIPLITINSGTNEQSEKLGAIMHVGQPEHAAGPAVQVAAEGDRVRLRGRRRGRHRRPRRLPRGFRDHPVLYRPVGARKRRRDHRPLSDLERGPTGRVQELGTGKVRSAPPGVRRSEATSVEQDLAASRDSPCVRLARCRIRNGDCGRAGVLLEQLRRRHSDGRTGQLQRSTHRDRHHADAGSGHTEVAGAARLSTAVAPAGIVTAEGTVSLVVSNELS